MLGRMCKEIHKEIEHLFVCSFPYKENGWRFILSSSKMTKVNVVHVTQSNGSNGHF